MARCRGGVERGSDAALVWAVSCAAVRGGELRAVAAVAAAEASSRMAAVDGAAHQRLARRGSREHAGSASARAARDQDKVRSTATTSEVRGASDNDRRSNSTAVSRTPSSAVPPTLPLKAVVVSNDAASVTTYRSMRAAAV